MTNYIGNTVPGDFYRDIDENELQRQGPIPLGRQNRKRPLRLLLLAASAIGLGLFGLNMAVTTAATNLALLQTPTSPLSSPAPSDLISNKAPTIMYVGTFFGTSNLNFSDNGLKDRLAKWVAPGMPPSFIEHAELSPAIIPLADNFFKRGGRDLIIEITDGVRWIPNQRSTKVSGLARIFNPNAEFEPIETNASLASDMTKTIELLKQLREIATSNLGSVTAVIIPALNYRFSSAAIAANLELKNTLEGAGLQYVNFGDIALRSNPLSLTSYQLNGWPSEFAHKLMFELLEGKLVGNS